MSLRFYIVEPEVAGGLGERTLIDRTSGRPIVTSLHYELEGWLGDELLESTPCYVASERMADEIKRAKLTGVEFREVEVTTSDEYKELYPDRQIPAFVWLDVGGRAGHDDFGIASGLHLVVSERALEILKGIGISHAASVTPFES